MKWGTNSRGVFFLIAFWIGKISYLTYHNGISYVEWYITWDINHKELLRGSEGEILAAAHSTQSGAETWRVKMMNQTDKDKWQVKEDPLAD